MSRFPLAVLALAAALLFLAADAAARTRGFCYVGVLDRDLHTRDCGKHQQVACDSGAKCDSGYRPLSFSTVTIDCVVPGVTDEKVSNVCYECGGQMELGCGGSSQCASGYGFATTSSLDGAIDKCSSILPPDPANVVINPPSVVIGVCPFCTTYNPPSVTVNPPPIEDFINAFGICSNGLPDDLSGASREDWPADERASKDKGSIFFIHGRGSNCSGSRHDLLNALPGGTLYERNHDVYCVDYDQSTNSTERRRVRVYPVVQEERGEGPAGCTQAGTCQFDLANPVAQIYAKSYSVPGVAGAVALGIEQVAEPGEVTLIGHSQGGFIVRALLHEHYDDLRWRGRKISRVMTLGHPFYGKVVDPKKVTPWMCASRDDFDCRVQEWLWGWQRWLGTAPGNIDDLDFPQIEWTAVSGDGLDAAGTGPGGTAPESEPDQCLAIFGGVDRSSVEGDTSVPILSSQGIDEHGFYPVGDLDFDDVVENRCAHGSVCLARETLASAPEKIPFVAPESIGLGSLGFDGLDDAVSISDLDDLDILELDDAATLEAWIWPSSAGQSGMILNKEGEYELGLTGGVLGWAIANTDPGWSWVSSGYTPPLRRWTHVAFVFDGIEQTAVTYVNGVEVHRVDAVGQIGDAHLAEEELWIGGRQLGDHSPFAGRIDDVRIWARSLDASEIRAGLRNGPEPGASRLKAWWRFDEGEAALLIDESTNRFDIALDSVGPDAAPIRRPEARSLGGGALYFDGIDDYVAVSDADALASLEMTDAVTMEALLFPRGPGGEDGGLILSKEGEYALVREADGSIAYLIANSPIGLLTTNAVAPERVWTHIAVAYQDGLPGQLAVYVNGDLVQLFPNAGAIGDDLPELNELRIGGSENADYDRYFHGVIDEVRVWSKARSAAEIKQFADKSLPDSLPAGLAGYWRLDETNAQLAFDYSSTGGNLLPGPGAAMPGQAFGPHLPGYPLTVPEPGAGASAIALGTMISALARRRRQGARGFASCPGPTERG